MSRTTAQRAKKAIGRVAERTKAAVAKAKLVGAEAGLVAKRAKYRLKTSKKARAAVVAAAAVTAVALGVAAVKKARKRR
ncbi:MAG: hypothetical protein FJ206_05320 [Gemmatimonadetes bacterium]|nr:hypothetical protein [Gemmatimonadota bacterium]